MNPHDVLRRPLVTEKSNYQSGKLNQYVFEVAPRATKTQIKDAVEAIFGKKVTRVNVLVRPYKRARRLRRMVRGSTEYKKAIVSLAPGETIDLFEGVK